MPFMWQAHLTFMLLTFIVLGSLQFTARWRPWLLPCLALASFISINDLSLAAHVRSYTDDLAISTLIFLTWACLLRLGVVEPLTADRRGQVIALFSVLALMLYPATLGLTYFDPYRWGYNPQSMIVVTGLFALALLWARNVLGVLMLAIGTLAFTLRLKASENYWDYVMDPLLALYCLAAGIKMLAGIARHPAGRVIGRRQLVTRPHS